MLLSTDIAFPPKKLPTKIVLVMYFNILKLFVNTNGINVKNISLNRFLLFIKVFFYIFCFNQIITRKK